MPKSFLPGMGGRCDNGLFARASATVESTRRDIRQEPLSSTTVTHFHKVILPEAMGPGWLLSMKRSSNKLSLHCSLIYSFCTRHSELSPLSHKREIQLKYTYMSFRCPLFLLVFFFFR